jgi:hypothetical protein
MIEQTMKNATLLKTQRHEGIRSIAMRLSMGINKFLTSSFSEMG